MGSGVIHLPQPLPRRQRLNDALAIAGSQLVPFKQLLPGPKPTGRTHYNEAAALLTPQVGGGIHQPIGRVGAENTLERP